MIDEANRLGFVETYYFAKKLVEIKKINEAGGRQVLNLGIGSPDLPPPSSVIDALTSSANEAGVHGYQSYRGIPQLKDAFGQWYKNHFDVDVEAQEEILPLIGSKEGVMHISMAYLNKGDEVLVPNPGYPAYQMTAKLAGANPVFYDLEENLGWLPNLDRMEETLDLSKVKIMWINYPNMPTGGEANLAFFEKLIAFGIKNNILICHDNPYTFILTDKPLSIMQVKNAKSTAIELVSLSKNYNMAGWRIGAIHGDREVINTILKFKSNMDSGMFRPMQMAAIEALNQGQEWFDFLNTTYSKRKILAKKILELCGCTIGKDGAGLFVFAKIDSAKYESAEVLADKILYDAGVFITPGHIFGSNGKHYLRVSLCSTESQLNDAYNRILKIMSK